MKNSKYYNYKIDGTKYKASGKTTNSSNNYQDDDPISYFFDWIIEEWRGIVIVLLIAGIGISMIYIFSEDSSPESLAKTYFNTIKTNNPEKLEKYFASPKYELARLKEKGFFDNMPYEDKLTIENSYSSLQGSYLHGGIDYSDIAKSIITESRSSFSQEEWEKSEIFMIDFDLNEGKWINIANIEIEIMINEKKILLNFLAAETNNGYRILN